LKREVGSMKDVERSDAPTVAMSVEARSRIQAFGGTLFVWVTVHGCCSGAVRVLETSGMRPEKGAVRFEPIDADGVTVQIDTRVRLSLHTLVIEPGRRGTVKAFWNGQAWVG
jgi:hypothetical protein